MTKTLANPLWRALYIAAEAHHGQVDKAGKPYFLHLLRVADGLDDYEARVVGVLHDLFEDCPQWNPGRLLEEGFSRTVVDTVSILTHRRGEDYESYIERICDDQLASLVKAADIADNSDLTRIAHPGPEDHARQEKYRRAMDIISKRWGPT